MHRFVVFLAMVAVASAALSSTETLDTTETHGTTEAHETMETHGTMEAHSTTEAVEIAMVRNMRCQQYEPKLCQSCAKKDVKECVKCMIEDNKCCLDPHKGYKWMKNQAEDYCKKWVKIH
ncbi:unnamed protein product [Dibothriocephalus latus]|uniref:PSI domain-containing protein n=1 Tax=Dibothriocephalus latus TaxID=60516 RepID=A0A3P7MCE1_DIBLA|nr:unnamed protein product [Dibothriocephalus latus]